MNESHYFQMKVDGASAETIAQAMKQDGLNDIERIRLLRMLFSLSLTEAKDTIIRADGLGNSLDEYQAQWLEPFLEALKRFDES